MSLNDSDKSEKSDTNGKSDDDSSPSSPDDKTKPSSSSLPDDQMTERSASSQNATVSSESDSLSSNIRISDVGIYSLCGLTSILFHQLYPEESNREFCKESINGLLNHLGLSSNQVKNSMIALLDGEGGHPEDFISLLKNEELLTSSCVPIIESLILFSIRGGVYDARLRVLILKIADLFNIPKALVDFHEESVIEMLSNEMPAQSDEQLKEKAKRVRNKKIKRYLLIGSGTLVGGAILGLTGGLVAPYLAIGAVSVFGAGSAAALGSTTGVAIIGSLFGVAGAGLTGHKMKKRVGDIEEFEFQLLNDSKSLEITILVSGWISDRGPDAFKTPWAAVQNTREQYCVRYESNYLLELGKALDYFLGFAVSMGVQEALKFTILSGIMAAIAWPATLLTLSSMIDNPWSCSVRRSADCGRYLAETLLNREHGKRPVSLIGFSLGARVIFFCLLELAQRENSEGIIQDAILLGAPVSGSLLYWSKFAKVVSGRIVNGYCRGDWLLKFLYRTTNASIKIAGLDAVDWKDRRMENVDLSDIVSGHLDYYKNLPEVLRKVGVSVNDNELNKTNSLMKKSSTGLPQANHLVKLKASDVRVSSIRMSISEPNFSQATNGEDAHRSSASSLAKKQKLERSHSLEDLQTKRSHKAPSLTKLAHSHTFTDFKRELRSKEFSLNGSASSSLNEPLSTSNSSANSELPVSSSINCPSVDCSSTNCPSSANVSADNSSSGLVNKANGGSTLNGSIKASEPKQPTRSRFSFWSRFSRRGTTAENIEELNEETEDALKDELSGDDKLKSVLSTAVDANLLKEINDEKLKDELNNKIRNELKDNMMLGELNDEKIRELNRKNQSDPDSPVRSVKRSDAEFLQLSVDSLNLRKSVLKRI